MTGIGIVNEEIETGTEETGIETGTEKETETAEGVVILVT